MNAYDWTPAEQAEAYLHGIPGAVEGQGGDLATNKTCVVLVNDFALSESEAWHLLVDWNRKCVPPWKEGELRIKLRSAMRGKHKNPRGSKLKDRQHRQQWTLPTTPAPPPPAPAQDTKEKKLVAPGGFGPGTHDQLKRLAALRGIGREGLAWAQERGVLQFGKWHDYECYGITDASGNTYELRRLDGTIFPAHKGLFGEVAERKTHSIRNSLKAWPVGILEAEPFSFIALTEGGPDFLAAHYTILWEQASHYSKCDVRCAPVAMLSASPDIHPDTLPRFKDKRVRIFPHADESGLKGAAKWKRQIIGAGGHCDIFDLCKLREKTNGKVKDLNDLVSLDDVSIWMRFPQLFKIMPDANHGN